jgi:hypothetical protein
VYIGIGTVLAVIVIILLPHLDLPREGLVALDGGIGKVDVATLQAPPHHWQDEANSAGSVRFDGEGNAVVSGTTVHADSLRF